MAMPPLFHFLQPKPEWPGVLACFACVAGPPAPMAMVVASNLGTCFRNLRWNASGAAGEGESLVSMPDAVQPHRWGNDG